jgi:hypothetical protein
VEDKDNYDFLKDQSRELHETVKSLWTIYIGWYTVFLTFNAGTLVFLNQLLDLGLDAFRVVSLAFAIFNVLGAITSLVILKVSRTLLERIETTRKAMHALVQTTTQPITYASTVADRIMVWAAIANTIALSILSLVWVYVALTIRPTP